MSSNPDSHPCRHEIAAAAASSPFSHNLPCMHDLPLIVEVSPHEHIVYGQWFTCHTAVAGGVMTTTCTRNVRTSEVEADA